MENNRDLQKAVEQLEESGRRQLKCARIQCIFSAVAGACCLVLLVVVCSVVPRVRQLVVQAQELAEQVEQFAGQGQELAEHAQELAGQAETVLINLEEVTSDLAGVDLETMVENVNALVDRSQEGVEQTIKKVEDIDIVTLNKAIEDFSDVVEPLAKFFNVFN